MKSYFRFYQGILCYNMKPSTVHFLAALLSVGRLAPDGDEIIVRKTIAVITKNGLCSRQTAYSAIEELQSRGILKLVRTYRKSNCLGQIVRAANEYHICIKALKNGKAGYTRIPRSLLALPLTHSAFLIAVSLYQLAGKDGRAFPSLSKLSQDLRLSRSTVCVALQQLRAVGEFIRVHCRRMSDRTGMLSHCFAANSYYATFGAGNPFVLQPAPMMVKPAPTFLGFPSANEPIPPAHFLVNGSPKIRQLPPKNKITGVHTLRKREIGVPEFSKLNKFVDRLVLRVKSCIFRLCRKDTG